MSFLLRLDEMVTCSTAENFVSLTNPPGWKRLFLSAIIVLKAGAQECATLPVQALTIVF